MAKKRSWAAVLTALGAASLLLLTLLAWREKTSDEPRYSMALLVVLGLGAVAAVATGVAGLMPPRHAGAEEAEPADYRHTRRLFGLVIVALLVALVARSQAVPES